MSSLLLTLSKSRVHWRESLKAYNSPWTRNIVWEGGGAREERKKYLFPEHAVKGVVEFRRHTTPLLGVVLFFSDVALLFRFGLQFFEVFSTEVLNNAKQTSPWRAGGRRSEKNILLSLGKCRCKWNAFTVLEETPNLFWSLQINWSSRKRQNCCNRSSDFDKSGVSFQTLISE